MVGRIPRSRSRTWSEADFRASRAGDIEALLSSPDAKLAAPGWQADTPGRSKRNNSRRSPGAAALLTAPAGALALTAVLSAPSRAALLALLGAAEVPAVVALPSAAGITHVLRGAVVVKSDADAVGDDAIHSDHDSRLAVPGELVVLYRDAPSDSALSCAARVLEAAGASLSRDVGFAAVSVAAHVAEERVVSILERCGINALVAESVEHHAGQAQMTGDDFYHLDRLEGGADEPRYDGMFFLRGALAERTHIYVLDTGLRKDHAEFLGRVGDGADFAPNPNNASECPSEQSTPGSWGHGTHVASLAAGTTAGVAKRATVHPVRVLGCTGSGSTIVICKGLAWVAEHFEAHGEPSVVVMSLGGTEDPMLDTCVERAIRAGLVVVVAAGNAGRDACDYSPARVPEVITVAATARDDRPAPFSNRGACVSIWAPGVSLSAASVSDPTGFSKLSGTSMAAPVVAGVAAAWLGHAQTLASASKKQTDLKAFLRRNAVRIDQHFRDPLGRVPCEGVREPTGLLLQSCMTAESRECQRAAGGGGRPARGIISVLEVLIFPDLYYEETTWHVVGPDGTEVSAGRVCRPGSSARVPLYEPGQYHLTVMDRFGDGMCCTTGRGHWSMRVDGVVIHESSGRFGYKETATAAVPRHEPSWCLRPTSPPCDVVPDAGRPCSMAPVHRCSVLRVGSAQLQPTAETAKPGANATEPFCTHRTETTVEAWASGVANISMYLLRAGEDDEVARLGDSWDVVSFTLGCPSSTVAFLARRVRRGCYVWLVVAGSGAGGEYDFFHHADGPVGSSPGAVPY